MLSPCVFLVPLELKKRTTMWAVAIDLNYQENRKFSTWGQERIMSRSEDISWGFFVFTSSGMNKWRHTKLNHDWSRNVPESSERKD